MPVPLVLSQEAEFIRATAGAPAEIIAFDANGNEVAVGRVPFGVTMTPDGRAEWKTTGAMLLHGRMCYATVDAVEIRAKGRVLGLPIAHRTLLPDDKYFAIRIKP